MTPNLELRILLDNYGANAVDGWEGMMIDDLKVISAGGTPAMQIRNLHNFTDNSSQTLKHPQVIPRLAALIGRGITGRVKFYPFENIQAPTGWRVNLSEVHLLGRGNIDNSMDTDQLTHGSAGSKGMYQLTRKRPTRVYTSSLQFMHSLELK